MAVQPEKAHRVREWATLRNTSPEIVTNGAKLIHPSG